MLDENLHHNLEGSNFEFAGRVPANDACEGYTASANCTEQSHDMFVFEGVQAKVGVWMLSSTVPTYFGVRWAVDALSLSINLH